MISKGDVRLRRLRLEDEEILAAYANNEHIAMNVRDGFPHPYSRGDARTFIERTLELTPPMIFAIEFQNQFCGVIGLHRQEDVYRMTAEIGYWIAEPFWRKGIATKAVKLLTDYGFKELDLLRIHTGVFEYNLASMKVLEKNGYSLEGVFHQSVVKGGKVWDEYRYAKLRITNYDVRSGI